jgi:hypothetical protein
MKPQIPATDSIEELAQFWDAHDVGDFSEELEEVSQPVFRRSEEIVPVPLTPLEREAVRKMAAARGLKEAALIHEWVREKLPRS